MRTIEKSYLTLVVWLFRRNKQYVKSSFVGRELLSYFLWSFDNPQVEVLCLNNEVVTIANLFLYLCNLFAWESWYDAVNKCSINATRVFKPLAEALRQLPKVDILSDAVFQDMTI